MITLERVEVEPIVGKTFWHA